VGRFAAFTREERDALHDGLMNEADLDPEEDPAFPQRVATAEALLEELAEDERGPVGG
jgi:hypothetical protein